MPVDPDKRAYSRKDDVMLRIVGIPSFVTAMTLVSTDAIAVYWRGITAPTNIDIHGWPIIKGHIPAPANDSCERLLGPAMSRLRSWLEAIRRLVQRGF